MKNNSIKIFASAALVTLVIMGAGCAKFDQFGNTNQDPNGITNPIPSALLTNAISQMPGTTVGQRNAVYAQFIAENQYTDASLYSLPLIEMGGRYSGPMQDMQTVIDYNSSPATALAASADGSNANQIAVAKIVKTYWFWITTDAWGDIPYSEALKGANNLSPKYDKQSEIYPAMIQELKDAVAGFDGGTAMKGDILYGGDINKWKKFANTMRMIMAVRMSGKAPAAAATAFNEATTHAAGIITTNADNAQVNFPGGSFQNTWYLNYLTRDDYASSKTMGDVLAGLGDTRGLAFGTNSTMFPYGLTRDLAIAYGNSVGNGQSRVLYQVPSTHPNAAFNKRNDNSPIYLITASVSLLARAEGKELWSAGLGAQADYEAGIAASYDQWGIPMPGTYLAGGANYLAGAGMPGSIGAGSAPYDNFRVASSNIQDAATTTKLQRIALQRWIAAFPNGCEGWAEQRRTGVPNLKTTRFATGAFVNRYVYGNNDYGLNNANTVAAAAAMGGDTQDAKVWWDF